MAAKRKIDYDRIEPEWRAGIKSPTQLAAEYTEATGTSVSRAAILKHFEKRGIARDLKAKIQAKAESLVAASMVADKVTPETKSREDSIVSLNANAVAAVRLAHREDITRGRKLAMALLAELEHQTDHQGLYDELADLVQPPADDGDSFAAKERARKLREAYQRALSLAGRTDTLKKLAETLRILIDKEREAFGVGDGKDGGESGQGAVEAVRALFLNQLHAGAGRLTVVREPARPQKGPLG
jgi:hypothetical protein